MRIHLRDDITIVPRRVMTTKQVPIHLMKKAEEFIAKAIRDGIVEPIDTSETSEFISRGFFVPKGEGKMRERY